jgi:hypothetical protein
MGAEAWSELNQLLEEEGNFFHDITIGAGISFHSILSGYDHVGPHGYRPGGYNEAVKHLDLLSTISEEDYMRLIKVRPDQRTNIKYEDESGHFPRILELTSASRKHIPAMDHELDIMRRLRMTYLEPMRELTYIKVPNRVEENEGRLFFYPEETAQFVEGAHAIRAYLDYRTGINDLRSKYFIDNIPVEQAVADYITTLDAFGHKWNEHWNMGSGNYHINEFGFINLCIMDAHAGSVVADALEAKDPTDVLLKDVPRKGIDKVIFRPGRNRLRNDIKTSLRNLSHLENVCIPSIIRNRADLGEYLKYIKRLKRGLRDKGVKHGKPNRGPKKHPFAI